MTSDHRQFAPATQRNRQPILAVLQDHLPSSGTILEIASGTGEHASYFAPHFPQCHWLPSDPNPMARASIEAWRQHLPIQNLYPAIAIDVEIPDWWTSLNTQGAEQGGLDLDCHPISGIININMIHISPWSACQGLMAGAEQLLPEQGLLYLYGPFRQNHRHTAPSNQSFDASLQAQNPTWGVRNLEDVIQLAQEHQLQWLQTIEMPANNLSVLFRKGCHYPMQTIKG